MERDYAEEFSISRFTRDFLDVAPIYSSKTCPVDQFP
jgi:hypothetical protein